MNLGEFLGKGALGAGKFLSNPKTYRGLEHLVNNAASAMESGYEGMQQNPHIGPMVTGAGVSLQGGVNAALDSPFTKKALSINPYNIPDNDFTRDRFKGGSPTEQQLQNRLQHIKDAQVNTDISKSIAQGRQDQEKTGNIYTWLDTLKDQAVDAPKFVGEAVSGIGEFVSGGLGDDWDKSWEDKGYKDLYGTFERENKNKMFFGKLPYLGSKDAPDAGRNKLAGISPEVKKFIPDEAFKDMYEGNMNSNYNLSEVYEQATKDYETDLVTKLLKQKEEEGEITPEKAKETLKRHLDQQKFRDFFATALLDPLMAVPFEKAGAIGKNILKAGRIPNVKNPLKLGKSLGKTADALTGKKPSSIIDDVEKNIAEIDNTIKGVETPPKIDPRPLSGKKLTETEFNIQKKKIMDDPSISFENKQQALRNLEWNTVFKKAKPTAKSIQNASAKEKVRELQQASPALDNKDVSEVILQQSKAKIQNQADEVANEAWRKVVGKGAGEVAEQADLVAMYAPPKVIEKSGKLVADPSVNIPQMEIHFRNNLQKLFYEVSLPYNKAIAEGYGMIWAEYAPKTSAIIKNFAEPMTKILTGSVDVTKVNEVKRVMGAIGSELAKSATKHTPGTPFVFDNLKSSQMLDDLLLNANRVPKIKKTLVESFQAAPKVLKETQEQIGKQYQNVSDYFTSIGIPEELSKKAAMFYTKLVEKSNLGSTKGMAVAADEGLTAGKAFNTKVLDELAGPDKAIAINLHEDFHQIFDYLRATSGKAAIPKLTKDIAITELGTSGKKYFSDIIRSINSIGTDSSVIYDELMSYFVQTKSELGKGIFTNNPVSKGFVSLFRKAQNGDKEAIKLLDNLEGIEQGVRQHADTFEKGIIEKLQQTVLPDGNNAWEILNRLDLTKIKGALPGKNFGKGMTSLEDVSKLKKSQVTKEALESTKDVIDNVNIRNPKRINYKIGES